MQYTSLPRLKYIDAAKGIGIAVIVWGHLDYLWSPASVWFSSFKLAIFYIISGLLTANRFLTTGKAEDWKTVAKKRLYSLGVPFAVYSLLAIVFHVQYCAESWSHGAQLVLEDLRLTLSLRGILTLWFLPTLFFSEVLFAAAKVEQWSGARKLLVTVLLPVLLSGISVWFGTVQAHYSGDPKFVSVSYVFLVVVKSLAGFWFVLAGYLIYRHADLSKVRKLPLFLLACAVNLALALLNPNVDFNFFVLDRYPLLFFANGVLGSVVVLELLRWLEQYSRLKAACWCGKNSLFIMATHFPWYLCTRIVSMGNQIYYAQQPDGRYYLLALAEFLVLMLVEAVLIRGKEWLKKACYKRLSPDRFASRVLKYL